jgi:hypothetical protein
MRRWLLKQWHRFTLGRTAIAIRAQEGMGGTKAHIAWELRMTASHCLPLGVTYEVVARRATDIEMGTVRIVLEISE